AEVHREALAALAGEHAAIGIAAGNTHVIDVRPGVVLVGRRRTERLGADVVARLHEAMVPGRGVRQALPELNGRLPRVLVVKVAAADVHGVRLPDVQRVDVAGRDHADVVERHRDVLPAGGNAQSGEIVPEPEPEGDVLPGVTVVVDVDVVGRLG